MKDSDLPFRYSREVLAALREGLPLVVLESSLFVQGLPPPHHLETAFQMEEAVRREGAVPAITAILEGEIRVGLEGEEIRRLADLPEVCKAAPRDLPFLCAKGAHGSTTVASALWIAKRLDLPVAATGAIGGVHRGGPGEGDVSADLEELARCGGRLLVCSGAKNLLDLRLTLERLETLGIPVLGYRSRSFPAFYCLSSGLPLEHGVETPQEAAAVLREARRLGLSQALLLTQPVPAGDAIPEEDFQRWLLEAESQARQEGVRGKDLTPFLLKALRDLSGGKTVAANQALVLANARLAARIARLFHPSQQEG